MSKPSKNAALLAALCLMMAGCQGSHHESATFSAPILPPIPTVHLAANARPWEVASDSMNAPSEAYLGNGYLGFRAGPLGGWVPGDRSQLCLIAGDYRNNQIQSRPSPAAFQIFFRNESLQSTTSRITGYRQVLQMRDGVLTTQFTWQTGGKAIPLTITTLASRDHPHLVVTHVSGPGLSGLKVIHLIYPDQNTGSTKYVSPAGDGGPSVVMQAASVTTPSRDFEWTGYTAIETSDDGPNPQALAAADIRSIGPGSYEALRASHEAEWHALWKSDIIIDGDPPSQQMIHAALFYLLESTRSGSRWSIPPMGLSGNDFGGHVFWDAPMWMFPALVLLHPDEARPMVDYAVRMLPEARKLAAKEGRPGASYPWESARSGMEVAEPTYAAERHVSADIANMIWRYYLVTGDRQWLRQSGFPVLSATASYWVSRMNRGADGKYHIRNVVGPDENAGLVNDDAFTNGVVKRNLEEAVQAAQALGLSASPAWSDRASRMYLPFDPKLQIYAPHDGYKGAEVKQADASLLIYPLDLVTDPAIIRKTLSYYPPRIERSGPAMTSSIFATIAARQGLGKEAMRFFLSSYEPFLMSPFDEISEKHSRMRQYCFMTGLGGLVQSVIYGFGGITFDGAKITSAPHLPPGWKSLTLRGVHFRGRVYSFNDVVSNGVPRETTVVGARILRPPSAPR
ncbi:MAG TPA: hypothetical protein VFJ58_14810 [Armatimonadota bacterium]|nr:hypothetical protein [Armatimonadota bacterium]